MEFVPVKRFWNYIEANITQGMPEANGTFCCLQDENLGMTGYGFDQTKKLTRPGTTSICGIHS